METRVPASLVLLGSSLETFLVEWKLAAAGFGAEFLAALKPS